MKPPRLKLNQTLNLILTTHKATLAPDWSIHAIDCFNFRFLASFPDFSSRLSGLQHLSARCSFDTLTEPCMSVLEIYSSRFIGFRLQSDIAWILKQIPPWPRSSWRNCSRLKIARLRNPINGVISASRTVRRYRRRRGSWSARFVFRALISSAPAA